MVVTERIYRVYRANSAAGGNECSYILSCTLAAIDLMVPYTLEGGLPGKHIPTQINIAQNQGICDTMYLIDGSLLLV